MFINQFTKMRHLIPWVFYSLLLLSATACQDPDYNKEAYVPFGSVDELSYEVLESIKGRDSDRLLRLLDNRQVINDLLAKATGDDVADLKARRDSPQGRRAESVNQLAQKQRVNAFLAAGIPPELDEQLAQLRSSGVVFSEEKPFAEGSPAKLQRYELHLSTPESSGYTYNLTIIYWNGYYHLIEVGGYLEKL